MKKIVIIAVLLTSLVACGNGDENQDTVLGDDNLSTDLISNPNSLNAETTIDEIGRIAFNDTIHDFGNLSEGEIIEYEFTYKNIGKKEVIITDAVGSCGCTVPSYDKKPIAPGEEGNMLVTFNSKGKPGYNEKHVIVSTNAAPAEYRLTILATVK